MNTKILPVAVYPSTANSLYIRSITLGPPPAYFYELSNVTEVEKTREVANPAYVPESVDADGNAVPPKGEPTITQWRKIVAATGGAVQPNDFFDTEATE